MTILSKIRFACLVFGGVLWLVFLGTMSFAIHALENGSQIVWWWMALVVFVAYPIGFAAAVWQVALWVKYGKHDPRAR